MLEPGAAGWGATVEVVLRDGSRSTAGVDGPLGHANHPASADDLCRKWQRLTDADGTEFLERLLAGSDSDPFAGILEEAFASSPQARALLRR